jgi:periplasmic divalent cation tolerance protein
MNAVFVYVTAASRDEALRIGRAVVEERLAACANVLDGMTSIFHWNGAVQEEREAVLILKSRSDLADALTGRVRELHSYDCPCVAVLPITAGSPAYLDWITRETHGGKEA